jgi:hypothetical protein
MPIFASLSAKNCEQAGVVQIGNDVQPDDMVRVRTITGIASLGRSPLR